MIHKCSDREGFSPLTLTAGNTVLKQSCPVTSVGSETAEL